MGIVDAIHSHCECSTPMPKQVDHHVRRRLIAEALWRVTVRQGLEEVSLRHVATEAGVSMGLVQHYFASKDEMLLFALDTLNQHVSQRVAERVAALPDPDAPRSLVRAVLLEMLPLDQERRDDAVVGFAFLVQAAMRPAIATTLQASFAQLQDFVSAEIRRAREAGETRAGLDSERETLTLLALLDGLTVQVLAGQGSPETALAVLDYHLDHLFSTASTRNHVSPH